MAAPGLVRRYGDHLLRCVGRAMSRSAGIDYRWRSWMERLVFSRCQVVHDLPPIFHYWSNRYLRPKLEALGVADPDQFFLRHLERCYDAAEGQRRFVSIGAGSCDLEMRLAIALRASGRDRFVIDGLDLNRSLIAHGVERVSAAGLTTHVRPQVCDLAQKFRRVSLLLQLDRFDNWDCAKEGFEGIRAQDILPLLVERFSFDVFLAFANVIDPFVERSFGPNFSVDREWDCAFIDRVHARDEQELAAGRIKPTHMFAVMGNGPSVAALCVGGVAPAAAVRRPH